MSEIPSADWSCIHANAERFERAWKKGPRPRIEDFLATVGESFQPQLLEELLRVEREIRRRGGEAPHPDDYRKRFPEHLEIIASVFRPHSDRPQTGGQGAGLDATLQTSRATGGWSDAIPPALANDPNYEFLRELDRGGMGVVYLAHHRVMVRDEVLKVLSRKIIDEPGVSDRFLREIRAVAKLRHPNIVSAFNAFFCGPSLVFAMEYVVGLDLRRMVKARGALPAPHPCSYVHQAALGLQHAHEEGMVHRDIKPGNLMLSYKKDRAVIKLLDFGLSKATSEQNASDVGISASFDNVESSAHLTSTGEMLGTPDFIAPEQIDDPQSADIRADIYSLGCALHFLLAGKLPFPDMALGDVLRAHRSKNAARLDHIRKEIPPELADLVAKMMAKEPADRFEEPSEVTEALAPFFKKRSAADRTSRVGTNAANADSAGLSPDEFARQVLKQFAFLTPGSNSAEAADSPDAELWPGKTGVKDRDGEIAEEALAPRSSIVLLHRFWPLAAGLAALTAVLVGILGWTIGGGASRSGGEIAKPLALPSTDATGPDANGTRGTEGGRAVPADQALTAAGALAEKEVGTPATPAPPLPPHAKAVAASSTSPPPQAAAEKAKIDLAVPSPKPAPLSTKRRGSASPWQQHSSLGEQVRLAIENGVRFLKAQQYEDGSWKDVESQSRTGTTRVTLALLSAGEQPESPSIRKALEHLRRFEPRELRSTYAISLQTMAFVEADPARDKLRIAANVVWLENAQITNRDRVGWAGTWTYSDSKNHPGDNSNTRWALMALHEASEAGVPVKSGIWKLARTYCERSQKREGSWAYTPAANLSTASMTCAGISSSILTMLHYPPSDEDLRGAAISNCRTTVVNRGLRVGIDWLARNYRVGENSGAGQQWKFYCLCGLERAGRLAGLRYFGEHDWYREAAKALFASQNRLGGSWRGAVLEENRILATSFAVLFLAKGRAPVLMTKLRHLLPDDWNNDPDDVRNLVSVISRTLRRR
jgi:serine/threonine protein kinase